MNLYLDTCVLNRPSDDVSQPRIRSEAESLGRILDLIYAGRITWSSSTVLRYEIERNPDPLRRVRALDLLTSAMHTLTLDTSTLAEAQHLISRGFQQFDALHLALARQGSVDVFLTTDDRLIRTATRELTGSLPSVLNPVDWLRRRQLWLLQP